MTVDIVPIISNNKNVSLIQVLNSSSVRVIIGCVMMMKIRPRVMLLLVNECREDALVLLSVVSIRYRM